MTVSGKPQGPLNRIAKEHTAPGSTTSLSGTTGGRRETSRSLAPAWTAWDGPVVITGVIRRVDSERRIVRAADDAGRVRAFDLVIDVPRLEDLKPGERIQAIGPVEG